MAVEFIESAKIAGDLFTLGAGDLLQAWIGTALAAYEAYERSDQSDADAAAGKGSAASGGPSQSNTRMDQQGSTYNFGGFGGVDGGDDDNTALYVVGGVVTMIALTAIVVSWRS